jgi:hypothetical protein
LDWPFQIIHTLLCDKEESKTQRVRAASLLPPRKQFSRSNSLAAHLGGGRGGQGGAQQGTGARGEQYLGDVWGVDSLRRWATRNWFDIVASDEIRRYRAGTRVERLKTMKGAFACAGKRYIAKKEDIPRLPLNPGRIWGVVGRKHLPFGKCEVRQVSAAEAVQLRRTMRRYRVANTPPDKRKFLRKSQLWSQEFTAKLFCNVEFWLSRADWRCEKPIAYQPPSAQC